MNSGICVYVEAWEAGGVLGFVWAASADSQHPFPFVRVVRIRKSTNQRGDVGLVAVCGAGGRHPTLGVGWLDDRDSNAMPNWQMTLGDASTHQPNAQAWGGTSISSQTRDVKPIGWRLPLRFGEEGEGRILFRRL